MGGETDDGRLVVPLPLWHLHAQEAPCRLPQSVNSSLAVVLLLKHNNNNNNTTSTSHNWIRANSALARKGGFSCAALLNGDWVRPPHVCAVKAELGCLAHIVEARASY